MTVAPPNQLLGARLLAETAALVAVPSVSHHERALADQVETRLRAVSGLAVERIADNVIARTTRHLGIRIVLAGHLDTVPPNDNAEPRVDESTLWGLGSADMKGGLAVMLNLAETVDAVVDVTYVFYSGEEVARHHNGLLQIEAAAPDLLAGDAAVLGEPTNSLIEAGCQGTLKLELHMGGARAHTARPWMGVNAIHRLGPALEAIAAFEARQPEIDGCRYREALQAVAVEGGVAANVVPDSASVTINHRFAPDRDLAGAEAAVRSVIGPFLDPDAGDRLEVVDSSPAAAPNLTHPLLAALVSSTGAAPRAKLGWTDVAFFTERGIPAVNFGPGDPELAHTAGERVTKDDLERAYRTLSVLLTTGAER